MRVVVALAGQVQAILAVVGQVHGEAFRLQAPAHRGGQPPLVLYHEHSHAHRDTTGVALHNTGR